MCGNQIVRVVLFAAMLQAQALFARTSWKGMTSMAWNTAANWFARVLTATLAAIPGGTNTHRLLHRAFLLQGPRRL